MHLGVVAINLEEEEVILGVGNLARVPASSRVTIVIVTHVMRLAGRVFP